MLLPPVISLSPSSPATHVPKSVLYDNRSFFFLIQVPQELFLGNLPISEGAPSWGQFSLLPPHGYRLAARHGAAGHTLALVSPVGGFVHLKDCDIRHPGGHMSFSWGFLPQAQFCGWRQIHLMGAQVRGVLWSGATHGWEPIPAPRETPMSVWTWQVLLVSAHVVGPAGHQPRVRGPRVEPEGITGPGEDTWGHCREGSRRLGTWGKLPGGLGCSRAESAVSMDT